MHLTNTSPCECVYNSIRSVDGKCHFYTLLSFAYQHLEPSYASTFVHPKCEIILDSGAFTAWSQGKIVNIKAYLNWATNFTNKYQHKLARIRYINLDVIPGNKGTSATPLMLKSAASASMKNADYLRANGIDAIEVFHQDEPFELLTKIVERSEGRLIALSPRNDVSAKRREAWLKQVLAFCLRVFGKQNIPAAHGLAVTGERLMYAFPFYSVDSSSWTSCLRFGDSKESGLPTLPKWKDKDNKHAYDYALRCEIKRYQQLADSATKLWEKRGILWD